MPFNADSPLDHPRLAKDGITALQICNIKMRDLQPWVLVSSSAPSLSIHQKAAHAAGLLSAAVLSPCCSWLLINPLLAGSLISIRLISIAAGCRWPSCWSLGLVHAQFITPPMPSRLERSTLHTSTSRNPLHFPGMHMMYCLMTGPRAMQIGCTRNFHGMSAMEIKHCSRTLWQLLQ